MTTLLALNSSIDARRRMGELANTGKPFRNGNDTLKGRPDRARSFGQLPRAFWEDAETATFTIYSYSTPIAWLHGDGSWVIPDVKYSATTSKHQGFVRAWVISA